ncbi:hypothetical protein CFC21_080200 [Triticum aestivum]|uniref:C2H2-type domain-containing protein n=2 Tax=Triticum aestivum TaxID=4565 RepID=A0A3B6MYP8_WHEAT|nr:uncharacterized protein LOC123125824 isoform X2 [Triticum aestivum]KAF7075418.1 hypothetical protein CFC21_080200 [Triticum aestivum]
MAEKRKADDNLNGTRHPAARTDPTAGDELAGTSAQASGPTANPTGDGIAGTSQALAGLTAATTGSAGGSSQSGGAARGARGGSGYRGFSQSQPHRRAPQMPSQGMLRPPQMPSQRMLRPPRGNPAVGSAPFPYHAPTGNGSLSGPRQTGTGQPLGHSGSGGPSSAISSASAPGAPVNPLVRACPRCNRPTIVFLGLSPLCADCLSTFVISYVLPRHPEIHYGGASSTTANGHQRQLDHRLRQPSSAALPRARAAVGPLRRAPTDGWCNNCLALTRGVLGSSPLCDVCYNRLFVAGDVPPQHAQTGGHVLPSPVPSYAYAGVPRGPVPAGEQQYRAAAIGPSSTSSSAVGSGPICQACGHPFGTGNRACRLWRLHGPPPPPPGLG